MKKFLLVILIFISIAVIGCAEKSGVYPSGDNSFSISNQASTGFSGMQDIRAEAYRQASDYCKSLHKDFSVIEADETKPPYVFGNYPRINLKFRCK